MDLELMVECSNEVEKLCVDLECSLPQVTSGAWGCEKCASPQCVAPEPSAETGAEPQGATL